MIDYHIHTYLCDHAVGEPQEYVDMAFKKGIEEIGFSDHAPLPMPYRYNNTMEPEELEFYIKLIEELKHKYGYKIKLGLEVDYPLFNTFDKRYFNDFRFDYFIGSCHILDGWPFDHPMYISEYEKRDINEVYRQYYQIINQMIETKLFDIIGHFDLVKKFGYRPTQDLNSEIDIVLKNASKHNIAIEINTSGLRKPAKEIYPSIKIIEMMFDNNVPITLGSDAHAPEEVAYEFEKTLELLKKIGYRKLIGISKRKKYSIEIE